MVRRFTLQIMILGVLFLYSCDEPKEENPITFAKTFGGSGEDYGRSVQEAADGGYIIVGSTTDSFGYGNGDVWLIKTDANGNEEWNQTFGGSDYDLGRSVKETIDGGYIITGDTRSFGLGWKDLWLIKTDSKGNEVWSQTFGGIKGDDGESVIKTPDGGYVIAGFTGSFGNGNGDVWLIKTDSEGNEEWNQTFGGSKHEWGRSVNHTTDGGYIITGNTESFGNGFYDVWLIKTDANGNEEWNQTFGGSGSERGQSVMQTNDGGYIIVGDQYSYEKSDYNILLIKTDSEGNEEWNQTFGGSNYEYGRSVQETSDGGFIITGTTMSFGNGGSDIWLIKTDPYGNTVLPEE